MKNIYKKVFAIAIAITLFSAPGSHALLGTIAEKGAREAIEFTARKFGISLADEAGRVFAERAAGFIGRHGAEGARLLTKIGPEIIDFAAKHGDDAVRMCVSQGDEMALYIMKNADEILPVWRTLGPQGVELFVKHPGFAGPLVQTFGQKAISAGAALSTSSVQKLVTLAGKAASAPEKEALLAAVLKYGDKILEFLWRHKGKLATGATVYGLIAEYEDITVETKPDGTQVERRETHRPIEKIANAVASKLAATPGEIIKESPAIGAALIAFIIFLLWPLFSLIRTLLQKTKNFVCVDSSNMPQKQPSPNTKNTIAI